MKEEEEHEEKKTKQWLVMVIHSHDIKCECWAIGTRVQLSAENHVDAYQKDH